MSGSTTRCTRSSLAALLLLASLVGPVAVAPPAMATVGTVQLVPLAGTQSEPTIVADGIVFQSSAGADGPWDLWFADLTGTAASLDTRVGDQIGPGAVDTLVVYLDRPAADLGGEPITSDDVVLMDLDSGSRWILSDSGTVKSSPSLSGALVVWTENVGGTDGADVYRYDLAADHDSDGTPNYADPQRPSPDPALAVFAGGPGDQEQAAAGDAGVVWLDGTAIKFKTKAGAATTLMANVGVSTPAPDTRGSLVVWAATHGSSVDVAVHDIGTGALSWRGSVLDSDRAAVTDGENVAWVRYAAAAPSTGRVMLSTSEETLAPSPISASQASPSLGRGVLAWADYRNDAELADIAFVTLGGGGAATVGRIGEADRFQTAAAISAATYPGGAGTPVVLATGMAFPDALSASGLAGVLHGSLLLTGTNAVPAAVWAELARLDSEDVYIVGGEAAVSSGVRASLERAGYTVTRVFGADRYGTSAAVARIMRQLDPAACQTILIATGSSFADALALAPAGYGQMAPVLLSSAGGLPTAISDVIVDLEPEAALIAGGSQAVPTSVEGALIGMGIAAHREGGTNRYHTAALIAEYSVDSSWATFDYIGVATGESYADALAGGVACGANAGVQLLTSAATLSPEAAAVLGKAGPTAQVVIFGGTAAVRSSCESDIVSALTS